MTHHAPTNTASCALRGETSKRLVLLRHAQAGLHGRFCGHSDPRLTEQGRAQLPAIVHGLSLASIQPSAIWSSDLQRARETAAPIAEYFGLQCLTAPDLREMNFGLWEGLTWSQIEAEYPQDAQAWMEHFPRHRPPGGESFAELQARVAGELESLASGVEAACTLVVTHGGFIRTAVAWVLGIPDARISRILLNHGAVTILQKLGSHWSIAAVNLDLAVFAQINQIQ